MREPSLEPVSATLMTADGLRLVSPCCTRAVRRGPFFRHAIAVIRRTCPKCRARYQVTLRPIGAYPTHAVHEAAWLCIRGVRGDVLELSNG